MPALMIHRREGKFHKNIQGCQCRWVIMTIEYILFGMTGYVVVFRLLVNIGLDSGPDDAQPFVSKWYHSPGGTHQLV